MSGSADLFRRMTAVMILGLFVVPLAASTAPLEVEQLYDSDEDIKWWENTNMDKNKDRIHDAIWMAPQSSHYDYVDENNRISVIVDFDHTPSTEDEKMLEENVSFQVQFRYWLIDSIAGKVNIDLIPKIVELPGVVFVELDGRLQIQMNDVNEIHDVTQVCKKQDIRVPGA